MVLSDTRDIFDVFVSYSHADTNQVLRLVGALRSVGLAVWHDQKEILAFNDIAERIRTGLARSKTLLAYYSASYSTRRACQWEMTAAYLAAASETSQTTTVLERVGRRVLVVNSLSSMDHIEPKTLRSNLLAMLPSNPTDDDFARIALDVHRHVANLDSPIALTSQSSTAIWTGLSREGDPSRFAGRTREMWEIHSGLEGAPVLLSPKTTGLAGGYGTVQLMGPGGMGKSLLAEEYARRFAPVYPGGVFWLFAGEGGDETEHLPERRYLQWFDVAIALGVDPATRLAPTALLSQLQLHLGSLPGNYLWVVDDLPFGLDTSEMRRWLAPSANGRTLVTTRDQRHSGIGVPVVLQELDGDFAVAVLSAARSATDLCEFGAVKQIAKILGNHALALDLAGQMAPFYSSFADLLTAIENPSEEALDLARDLEFELPNGHQKSIAATLLRSLRPLANDPTGLPIDALRLASLFAPQRPILFSLLGAILLQAGVERRGETLENEIRVSLSRVQSRSLCGVDGGTYSVHPLISRTVRFLFSGERLDALASAALVVFNDILSCVEDHRTHQDLRLFIPHALALVRTLLLIYEGANHDRSGILVRMAKYFWARGNYEPARKI